MKYSLFRIAVVLWTALALGCQPESSPIPSAAGGGDQSNMQTANRELVAPAPSLGQTESRADTASAVGTTSVRDAADFTAHIRGLRERYDLQGFTVLVQAPFVVIGDEDAERVARRSEDTVRWAVDHLRRRYFDRDPQQIIDIWLFRDKESYESHCKEFFGITPHTPYGFYSPAKRALIMNIATGGGTLVHEIVHPFIAANFPNCPAWFNEGLASLYEQCREHEGQIWGSTNWRLRGLQSAVESDRLGSFDRLLATTTREFYDDQGGLNYAQARYLCYYLQEQGVLPEFYRRFCENVQRDPTGKQTLLEILQVDSLDALDVTWRSFVRELRF